MVKKSNKGRRSQAEHPSASKVERIQTSVNQPAEAQSKAKEGQTYKRKKPSSAQKKQNSKKQRQALANSDSMGSLPAVEKYGMKESRERLLSQGFHPEVSSEAPEEVQNTALLWAMAESVRPTRESFLKEAANSSKLLTRAPLVWRGSLMNSDRGDGPRANPKPDHGAAGGLDIKRLLKHAHAGPQIIENVYEDGRKTVMKLARTSHSMWAITTSNVNIWDFVAGRFSNTGHSRVFVVTTPNYTLGEVLQTRIDHPYGLDDGEHPDAWKSRAIDLEENIFTVTKMLYKRCQLDHPFWATQPGQEPSNVQFPDVVRRNFNEKVSQCIGSMKAIGMDKMWQANQFTGTPTSHMFTPPLNFAVMHLKSLMVEISTRRASITILHFHKTPLLDRRMIAIILRACTSVVMVGVYDCPLIHFGDVICLLDLIHEINIARRLESKPEIHSFDFYPHFNEGMPYAHERAATLGLTWSPMKLEVIQRGFYFIILKAFMKAKAMKLDLLFHKGKSFLDYLYKVPNAPLGVPAFLDAIYRYLDINEQTNDAENETKRAIYDLLKPVRLGLEYSLERDWPHWYINTMGKYLFFCSSCGYEMFEDFFTAEGREMRPHTRTCAGCTLQRWLDTEQDHLKEQKRGGLTALCPAWYGKAFNIDAPILEKGQGLIRLKTVVSVRPPPPTPFHVVDGVLHRRRYLEPLVRDNKIHYDSLRSLPSLSELATGVDEADLWSAAGREFNRLDIQCRVVRQLRADYPEYDEAGEVPPFASTREDGAMPDHFDEVQPARRENQYAMSHDVNEALRFYMGLKRKGW